MSPSNAEGPASASADCEPLNFEQLPGRLIFENITDPAVRQAKTLARRFGLTADRARLIASIAFAQEAA